MLKLILSSIIVSVFVITAVVLAVVIPIWSKLATTVFIKLEPNFEITDFSKENQRI